MYLPWREKKIFKFWLYKYVYNCKFILTELYYIRKLIENWLKINQIWKIFIEKIIFCLLKTNWIYYIIANNIALVFIVNINKFILISKKNIQIRPACSEVASQVICFLSQNYYLSTEELKYSSLLKNTCIQFIQFIQCVQYIPHLYYL